MSNSRAAFSIVTNEPTFNLFKNDTIQFTSFPGGTGLANPFTLGDALNLNHVTEYQSSGSGTVQVADSSVAFPGGEHFLDSNNGGDITMVFDHPLRGFGVEVESGFQTSGGFLFAAYSGPTNNLVLLGSAIVARPAGNQVSFLGATDSVPEITAVFIRDNNASGWIQHAHLNLVTNAFTAVAVTNKPLLLISQVATSLDLKWSTTNPAIFHAQYITNLANPSWQALSGSISNGGGFYHQFATPATLGKTGFFRLSTGSP